VDPVGVPRAFYYIFRREATRPGGSSLVQQLVKLTYLSSEKSMSRKIKEAVLSLEINRRYSKDDILEIYLNHIFYGNLAYGAEAAAQTYFGKHASQLTLAEASLLAGIPQYPGQYDPYTHWNATRNRQADVLRLMVEHGFITPGEASRAWRAYDGKTPEEALRRPLADSRWDFSSRERVAMGTTFALRCRKWISSTAGIPSSAQRPGGLAQLQSIWPMPPSLKRREISPSTELCWIMRPYPCARIIGITRLVISCRPKTLVSNCSRSTSVFTSSSAPG
jgi:hypothetical protein